MSIKKHCLNKGLLVVAVALLTIYPLDVHSASDSDRLDSGPASGGELEIVKRDARHRRCDAGRPRPDQCRRRRVRGAQLFHAVDGSGQRDGNAARMAGTSM